MKYKAGDKVKIINNIHGHEFEMGETVTIIKVFRDFYSAENDKENWLVDDDEVEEL